MLKNFEKKWLKNNFWNNWFRNEGEEIREEEGVDVEDEDDEEDYQEQDGSNS